MQPSEEEERALPFIMYEEGTRMFKLQEEAAEFLRTLKGPLGIVAVAGMYRTGKSYLLNRMLLDRSNGFGVGPSINPCTKGLWLWNKPIQGTTPDGENINILVVDTEGLGALDEDSNHDVRVFSLAILLSSFFIYNSQGSIDENALQSLSLVINLTKHIHLRSNRATEDVDPEEFSQYFPSFMWVVRDFTLQLLDTEGSDITSKEYLEMALANQKGFSDGVEQKNRIRRLLKSFFKERDCCTMVRPLTQEDNLQNLDKLDINSLRPEFVEQVMTLRRKVIGRIKPKMLENKRLNGEMLANLAENYISAINKGACPNIETAWTYICKNECRKAEYEAFDKFEKHLQEQFELRGPFSEEDLEEIYKDAKKNSMEEFKRIAVGEEVQAEFVNELKDKFKSKFEQFKFDNEKQSSNECHNFLMSNYNVIEMKIKNGEYTSLYEIQNELADFEKFYLEQGPQGPNRRTIFAEFTQKAFADAANFFIKNLKNELDLQKSLAQDSNTKLTEQLKEIKEESKTKVDQLEHKLRSIETEKVEIDAKEQSLREQLTDSIKDKEQVELEMKEKVEQMRKEANRQVEEMKAKLSHQEESSQEYSRQILATESEFEKQKALLLQKNEFLEKKESEWIKKEQEMTGELKQLKKEHNVNVKDSNQKYDAQVKNLQKKVEDLTEKNFELESKIQDQDTQFEKERNSFEDAETKMKTLKTKLESQVSDLTQKFNALQKKYNFEIEESKKVSEDSVVIKESEIQDLHDKIKELEDQTSRDNQRFQIEIKQSQQKIEFENIKYQELEQQYKSAQEKHEHMVKVLQQSQMISQEGQEEANKKIQELHDNYNSQLLEIENKYEQTRQRQNQQIEQLTSRNQELEMSLKIQIGDYQKELSSVKEQLMQSEEERIKATDQLKLVDGAKNKALVESESRAQQIIAELERDLELKKDNHEREVNEILEKQEEQLEQMRQFFEAEKEKLERAMQQEKERSSKRYNIQAEEYDQRLKDEQENHENEASELQDRIQEMDMEMHDMAGRFEKQDSIKTQEIESLKQYNNDLKESLNRLQSKNNDQYEKALEKQDAERKELQEKIEKLAIELTKRERQMSVLENQKETLTKAVESKEKMIVEIRTEIQSEKNEGSDKVEQLRLKLSQAMDEITEKKIEYERERALKDQQLEFQEKRLTENQKTHEDTIKRYEDRMKYDREEMSKDYNERLERVTAEKEVTEQKYETKRRALKESEAQYARLKNQYDREKAVIDEKYHYLESGREELIKNYETQIEKKQAEIDQLTVALSSDKNLIQVEIEKWRTSALEYERQLQEKTNDLDREQQLWQNKFKFQDSQKEKLKADYEESQRKLSETIEQFRKNQSTDKQKNEYSQMAMIQQMEQNFSSKLKDSQEKYRQESEDLKKRNTQLERECKQYIERLELSQKSFSTDQNQLEKRFEKMYDDNRRLQEELDTIKQDRENKIVEFQKQQDKDKEYYKQKIKDAEGKGTGQNAKYSDLLVQYNKERAQWDSEKSMIIASKQDVTETNDRLQRKVETLTKENEKYKHDLKANKKNMYQAAHNTNTYLGARVGEKMLGNIGNLGGLGGGYKPKDAKFIGDGGKDSAEKSFTSAYGGGGMSKQQLETSLLAGKNILSTPGSSQKSESEINMSHGMMSPQEPSRK